MALFESREMKDLKQRYNIVLDESHRLFRENIRLKAKLYDVYGGEQAEYLAKELELTPLQKSKLGLVFSIERARACGVPEEKILKTKEEIDDFFTAGES